ncbi:unnamed protein product [Phyllotreta striolata]|uniref:cyclin-dependent kinase n=1 Tax=Phyllotreta striolata TaxID=444603 RepID=A0A9N9XJA0_PHYSR|nr:unnamed protein product [Phyllotreta striolata]
MSGNESFDEQSEDGELRQSPIDSKHMHETETMDFSISEEEEGEAIDSLDIKPPQAKIASQSKTKKREHERRKHSDRHREDRHSHRDKHHREKSNRSMKDREQYQRDKERYYREKHFEQAAYEAQYRERKDEKPRSRHSDQRKHEEKKMVKESRHRDLEKHEPYEDQRKSKGDKALNDLRARLLSKRSTKGDEGHGKDRNSKRDRKHREHTDDPLQGEAGMLVKEIINLTTEEKKKFQKDDDFKMSEEERAETEQRKQKFLEAAKEMSRLKEQSRAERERRHQEKATKRKHEDDSYGKRQKVEEIAVVVSDNSDAEQGELYQNSYESEHSPEEENSPSPAKSEHSRVSSQTGEEESPYSERRSGTQSKSRSRSKSRSASESERSRSQSPKSEENDEEILEEEKEKDEKAPESPKPKVDESLPPYYPAVQGCRSVEEFQCLNRIEEGTYGVVYRARDKRTDDIVALKRLKMEKEKEGFPITSLREINTLLKGQHPNIVTVREIVVGSNMDKIFIVMDYVEHDLKSLMETMRHKKQHFMPGEIKCLLRQLLLAVQHLHDNWILHRDLKTSNLLLSHKGILKVGDFGLAREYGSPLKPYTSIVVTLWYRAPELLLCAKEYSTPIDLWSVGCIFAELVLMKALFPGNSEVDQLNKIFKDLGTPSESVWTGFNQLPAVKKMKFNDYPVSNLRAKFSNLSECGLGLLLKFLTYDPKKRVSAEEAMNHVYFNEPPLPIDPAMFPTWPAKSELGHKRALAASPKPPSGGGEYKKLGKDGDDDGYGFRLGMGVDARRSGPGFSLKF